MAKLLVLWDVDHTLIETGGAGRRAFAVAFERATGQAMREMAAVAGRTEPDIFHETLKLNGLSDDPELFHRFAAELGPAYEERADEMRQHGRALPGAAKALDELAELPWVVQSVLTGNIRSAAEIKLRIFGLDRNVDFDSGAYGSDDSIRSNLVAIAQGRAGARHGVVFDRTNTVVIGDTPGDVRTGLEGGAHVIAVASGHSSMEELAAAGARAVLPDLQNTESLVQALSTLVAGVRATLLVIYSDKPAECRAFYEQHLGLTFRVEQHSESPQHDVAVLQDGTVFEIYPATADRRTGAFRLGFAVPAAVSSLEPGHHVLRDPDNRAVEIQVE